MSKRILLVDDHDMFRAGLRALIQASDPGITVVEASRGQAGLERANELLPDVVIMDIHLPDRSGIDVSRELLERHPSTKVVIVSAESDLSYVNEALQAGVSGYLLKSSPPEELNRAIQTVLAGKLYLCSEANAFVLEDYRRTLAAPADSGRPALSSREREILRFIADGLRSKDMAARLELSVKTVETYRRRLTKKLGCSSTAELVRYALREGIVPP